MIKAIIFDVGGTYMAGSFIDFVNRSYRVLGIDKTFTTKDEIIFDENLNRGLVSHDESFRKFFGVPISGQQMEEIKNIWMTTWSPTEEMVELVKRLGEKYVLAVLSNSDSLNSEKYAKKGWYSYFDYLILSHETGLLKPDIEIYQMTLDRLKLPAGECLFIDDQEKVLVPARKLGMDTIHFKSVAQLKEELRSRQI